MSIPNVLSIAGSDPSGGAGIQADIKTFAALNVYGCAAIAALTAQNTYGVVAVHEVPGAFLRDQLDALFNDLRVDAVKIGMLGTADAVRVVVDTLCKYKPAIVVLDPVMRASSGASLLDTGGVDLIRSELLPLVTVVTPNTAEAGVLLGAKSPQTIAECRAAAKQLVEMGAAAALVTGGHVAGGDECVDVLCDASGVQEFRVARVASAAMHGTGCTLSSAIAALLARGRSLPEACREAQQFVAYSIARGHELLVGHGPGPVHQLGAMWSHAKRGSADHPRAP